LRFADPLTPAFHFHCCVIDGVFSMGEDGQVRFVEAGARSVGGAAGAHHEILVPA
jgi:hypothetical protein